MHITIMGCIHELFIVSQIGTVMHRVYPYHEHSATLVMSVMVEHTQEHPMMVSQADHVLKGHSVSQVLLSLILAHLGHTVRVPGEQVIRTVNFVILATTVLKSSWRHQRDPVILDIIALKHPFRPISRRPQLGISLDWGLLNHSLVCREPINLTTGKVAAFRVMEVIIVLRKTWPVNVSVSEDFTALLAQTGSLHALQGRLTITLDKCTTQAV